MTCSNLSRKQLYHIIVMVLLYFSGKGLLYSWTYEGEFTEMWRITNISHGQNRTVYISEVRFRLLTKELIWEANRVPYIHKQLIVRKEATSRRIRGGLKNFTNSLPKCENITCKMKRVPHKVEVSEVTFTRLMSEFLQTTHRTINNGNKQLKKLIFMRMNETADDAKDRQKRIAEITNKVDDMVKTLGVYGNAQICLIVFIIVCLVLPKFTKFKKPIFLQTYWNNLRFKVPQQASQQSIHIYETIEEKPCSSNTIELSTLNQSKDIEEDSHSSEFSEVWKSVEFTKYDTEDSSTGTWESVQHKDYNDVSPIDQRDKVSVKLELDE